MANRIHNASPLQSQGGLSSCRLTRGTFPARLTHKVNLTLGSNIEDSAATIAKLLGLLDLTGNVRVVGGARPIVIDILLYDSIERHDDILNIPHVAMQEREFVLRLLTPQLYRHISQLLSQLLLKQPEVKENKGGRPQISLPVYLYGKSTHWIARTLVMGILNTTLDSFSDDGDYSTVKSAALRAQ
ncbi:hypothetical protein BGX31_001220 [Mortierella sp. GBA43]|nr:hypothetical protein BGX31_001220 [Mortierella sp. GBA43]